VKKLTRNCIRDEENQKKLLKLGWKFAIVWECETKDMDTVFRKLTKFLDPFPRADARR